jgi:hypothetical protein
LQAADSPAPAAPPICCAVDAHDCTAASIRCWAEPEDASVAVVEDEVEDEDESLPPHPAATKTHATAMTPTDPTIHLGVCALISPTLVPRGKRRNVLFRLEGHIGGVSRVWLM